MESQDLLGLLAHLNILVWIFLSEVSQCSLCPLGGVSFLEILHNKALHLCGGKRIIIKSIFIFLSYFMTWFWVFSVYAILII